MRMAFEDAKHYMAEWDAYNAKVAKADKGCRRAQARFEAGGAR